MLTTKSQKDFDYQKNSDAVIIYFDPKDDLTRQEFKKECDINTLLEKFGADSFNQQRQPIYGDFDFDQDLQAAYATLDAAQRVYDKLPVDIKKKYLDYDDFIKALYNGDMQRDLDEALKPKPAPTPEPAPPPPPAT